MRRLVLLPGLAADGRMYARLGETGFRLETPGLPDPQPGEAMPAYAGRVADELALTAQDWLGGCSFGSMVASAIARQRPVAALVLLAGALDSSGLRHRIPGVGLLRVAPLAPLRWLTGREGFLRTQFGCDDAEGLVLLRAMLAATSDRLLREGGRLAATSVDPARPACPIHALHGAADRVLAPPPLPGCRLVSGAGHGLVFTHAGEVTRFLAQLAPEDPA